MISNYSRLHPFMVVEAQFARFAFIYGRAYRSLKTTLKDDARLSVGEYAVERRPGCLGFRRGPRPHAVVAHFPQGPVNLRVKAKHCRYPTSPN
jgi:hypothetical protein